MVIRSDTFSPTHLSSVIGAVSLSTYTATNANGDVVACRDKKPSKGGASDVAVAYTPWTDPNGNELPDTDKSPLFKRISQVAGGAFGTYVNAPGGVTNITQWARDNDGDGTVVVIRDGHGEVYR